MAGGRGGCRFGVSQPCPQPCSQHPVLQEVQEGLPEAGKAGLGRALSISSLHRPPSCQDSARLCWRVSFALQYFQLVFMAFTASVKVNGPGIQASGIFSSAAEPSEFKPVPLRSRTLRTEDKIEAIRRRRRKLWGYGSRWARFQLRWRKLLRIISQASSVVCGGRIGAPAKFNYTFLGYFSTAKISL